MYRLILASALMLLVACGSDASYVSVVDIPQQYWTKKEPVEFNFNRKDTVTKNTIYMIVRHTPEYKYDMLYLKVTTTDPMKKFWSDTLAVKLMNRQKEWIGQNMTTHFDLTAVYRKHVQFAHQGDYNMKVEFYFPKDSLQGIKALGLTIEKDGKK